MSDPVEARSLSALTNLFANPPQYPRNPTHKVHEPLVLYIPPTKATVSLEAIQSSLYYFHVNTVEDEELKRSIDQQRKSEEWNRPPVAVARKPVPSTPLAAHPLPPPPPPEEPEEYQSYRRYEAYSSEAMPEYNDDGTPERGAALRLNTGLNAGVHRKPVFPRGPTNIYNAGGDYAIPPSFSQSQTAHSTRDWTPRYAPSSSRGTSPAPTDRLSDYTSRPPPHSVSTTNAGSRPEAVSRGPPNFLPVTIIRRDPASGSQWNIGTITLLEPTFSGSNIRPVSVDLNTPGYGRFARTTGFETPRPGSARSDAASIKRAMLSATISPVSATSPETPVTTFHRVVDFRRMAVSDLRRTVYQRTNSSDSVGKIDPSKPGLEKNVLAFDSPWHGTCTFVNAIDGTSLKIKHTINSNSSAAESVTANVGELRFNLGWSLLSNIRDSDRRRKEPEPDQLPVPELLKTKKENFRKSFQHLKNRNRESFQRSKSSNDSSDVFKDLSNIQTPTTNNVNDPAYLQTTALGVDSQSSRHHSEPRPISAMQPRSSDHHDEENRLSLRLGREKAGGGFRGHSAKLGKLIIEDEGLKMSDLVVGAAMGVWWQHYGG
ncbi:hypothetical protein LTR24_009476 [Lithohypha guttulata]|uniref:Uncharacterized protein n=1 Tax=Lithohypha guttulata TaxID=1690604 RepID=A0ABR0JWV0_9EURO|nr:hypothetical protein LTR24_009476 [Lithohypha guttulata]